MIPAWSSRISVKKDSTYSFGAELWTPNGQKRDKRERENSLHPNNFVELSARKNSTFTRGLIFSYKSSPFPIIGFKRHFQNPKYEVEMFTCNSKTFSHALFASKCDVWAWAFSFACTPNNLPFHFHSEAFIHIHLHNGIFFATLPAITQAIIFSLLESRFTIVIMVVVDPQLFLLQLHCFGFNFNWIRLNSTPFESKRLDSFIIASIFNACYVVLG